MESMDQPVPSLNVPMDQITIKGVKRTEASAKEVDPIVPQGVNGVPIITETGLTKTNFTINK
jgi:hypothetical protein